MLKFRSRPSDITRFVVPLVIGVAAVANSWSAVRGDVPASGDENERIIVGAVNPHGFSPTESDGQDFDVSQLNLRRVFEAMGEDAATWYTHVVTLANPYYEGRAPGLDGNRRAADYIEWWFREFGLEPAFPEPEMEEMPGGAVEGAWTSYRQPFSFRNRDTDNVGAVLRGRGVLADEWIIIGGHYDHVGYSNRNPLNKAGGRVHPGADDNASGTAGVLLLAQRFAREYAERPEDADLRSILFLAFSAEESGLIGSRHYTRNSTIDARQIQIMLNLDMIGRLRDETMMVGGVGSAEGLLEMLRPHFLASGLKVYADPSGGGPSDHASFNGAGIPVLFFFTGVHSVYHQPGDMGVTVNPVGAIRVVDLTERIAWDMVSNPNRLVYQQQQPQRRAGGTRVAIGIVPDWNVDVPTGVKIRQITENSVAAEAGLRVDDIIIRWNGEELENMRALTRFLRDASPGDMITLVVLREGSEIEVSVQLREAD